MIKTISKEDVHNVKPRESVFVSCDLPSPIYNKLDIRGTWKTLYRGGVGEPPLVAGPGTKSRNNKLDTFRRAHSELLHVSPTENSKPPEFKEESDRPSRATARHKEKAKTRNTVSMSPRVLSSKRKSHENENFRKNLFDRMKTNEPKEEEAQSDHDVASTSKLEPWLISDEWKPIKGIAYTKFNTPWERNKDDVVRGSWCVPNANEKDMIPLMDLCIYPKNAELDDAIPHGVWATKPNAEKDAEGRWYPDGVLFYPPGMSPKEDAVRGQWAYPPGRLNVDWPPLTEKAKQQRRVGRLPKWETDKKFDPQRAIVHKTSKDLPPDTSDDDHDDNDHTTRGMWKSKKKTCDDWEPQVEVLLYPIKTKLDRTLPLGVWCTDPKAKADANGHWDPKNIWFYPPGEIPAKKGVVRGKWTPSFNKLIVDWPPLSESAKNKARRIGKLPKWETSRKWEPQTAKVHVKPAEISMDDTNKDGDDHNDDETKGIWKSNKSLPLEEMEPVLDVIIHPTRADIDESKPNGVWCTDHKAKADANGKWDPNDVWFFPPGEKPKGDIIPRGKWTFPPKKLDIEWPPLNEKAKQAKQDRIRATKLPKWERRKKWRPRSATVFSNPEDMPEDGNDGNRVTRGLWKNPKNASAMPEGEWVPNVDVIIHPLSAVMDDTKPHGLWCTDSSKEADQRGKWDSKDLWFYPPGIDPEAGAVPRGKWTLPPGRIDDRCWPAFSKAARMVRQPEWEKEPQLAKIYSSPTDVPRDCPDGDVTRGLWIRADDPCSPENEWEPELEVLIHPNSAKLDDDKPHGIWCTDPAVKSDEDGKWDPSALWFYQPGETPSDGIVPRGKWTLPPGKLDMDWPPLTEKAKIAKRLGKLPKWETSRSWIPQKASVYTKLNVTNGAKENKEGTTNGIWKSDDHNIEESKMEPRVDVIIHPAAAELEEDKPHGVWCTDPSARASDNGNWNPKDVWFYPPGAEPEPGLVPRGRWSFPVGELDAKWPPLTEDAKLARRAPGKLPKWETNREWKPQTMTVSSKRSALDEGDSTRGIWKSKNDDDNDWAPQEVQIYPSSTELDNARPHGVWGTDPLARPDKDGNWNPKDIWFYPPGTTPDYGIVPRGKWAFPPSKLDVAWPPPMPKRTKRESSVGRLKIPSLFDSPHQEVPQAFRSSYRRKQNTRISMPAIRASPAYLKSSRSTSINMGSFTPPLLSPRTLSAAKQKKRDIEKRFSRTALQAMPESTTPRTPNIDQLPSLPLDREPPHFVTGTVFNSIRIQEEEDLEPENTSSESSDESPLREVKITKEMLDKSTSSSILSPLSFKSPLEQVREGCLTHMKSSASSTPATVGTTGSQSSIGLQQLAAAAREHYDEEDELVILETGPTNKIQRLVEES